MLPQFGDKIKSRQFFAHNDHCDNLCAEKQKNVDSEIIINVVEYVLENVAVRLHEEMPVLKNECQPLESGGNIMAVTPNSEAPDITTLRVDNNTSPVCRHEVLAVKSSPGITALKPEKNGKDSHLTKAQVCNSEKEDNRCVTADYTLQAIDLKGSDFLCENDNDNPTGDKVPLDSKRNSQHELFHCPHSGCEKVFQVRIAVFSHLRRCKNKPQKYPNATDTVKPVHEVVAEGYHPPPVLKETPQGLVYECPYEGCVKQYSSFRGCCVHCRSCNVRFPLRLQPQLVEDSELNQLLPYKCPNNGCNKQFSSYKGCRIHSGLCKYLASDSKSLTLKEVGTGGSDAASPRQAALKARNNMKDTVESMNYRNWRKIIKYKEDYICKVAKPKRRYRPVIPDLRSATLEIINHWSKEILEKGGVRCDVNNCNKAFDNEVDMLNHWKRCGIKENSGTEIFSWSEFYKNRKRRAKLKKEQLQGKCLKKGQKATSRRQARARAHLRQGKGSELRKLLQMPTIPSWVPTKEDFLQKFQCKDEPYFRNSHFQYEPPRVFIQNYPQTSVVDVDFHNDDDDAYEPIPVECVLKPYVVQSLTKLEEQSSDEPVEEYLLPDLNPTEQTHKRNLTIKQEYCDDRESGRSLLKPLPQLKQIKQELPDVSDC